jgi:amino acid adenylation domain-containing protein
LLPQCPELYIVLLAILKAGKAFCPLNLDTPDERLKFILSDVSANLIITSTAQSDRTMSIHGVQTLFADRELLKGSEADIFVSPLIESADLAYVLYTSGSTGLPKAVSVSHKAVTQSLLAHNNHIPDFARFLQFAAPTFDVSIFEIFFPWFRGKTLVGCLRERMLEDLPHIINILEADAAELTPTVVGNLLQGRSSVPGLRLLLTIGEMLTQHVVTEYGDSSAKSGILWAMYGPTEAAIHCTLQAHFSSSSSTGSIGYPLETVSTFILAVPKGTPGKTSVTILPWGEEGELALGGHQIAREYLKRPELTAASFIEHPQFGRLYRTGDRARFRNDGTIECLGRMVAGQVKLRGQRVELGEIEQVILKVSGCRLAVATIIDDTLVAFCATGAQTITREEVLHVCKKWLPTFMIPSNILIVKSMPQLSSGKIDRRSLEKAYSESLQHQDSHVQHDLQPDEHAALAIYRLVQDCLGRQLSLETELAAAGLDSLQAIRIASRLRIEGYNFSAVDVLASQTLHDLITACKHTTKLTGAPHSTEMLPEYDIESLDPDLATQSAQIGFISPCTPLQEAMLAETVSRPNAYCNWIELELSVTRTYDEIVAALSHLAIENSILRSGFYTSSSGDGTFVQVTWKELERTQIKKVSQFERAYALDNTQALLHPFLVSVQDEPDRQRVLLQLHHALYDGWSLDLLLTDLDKLLRLQTPMKRPQFRAVSQYHTQRSKTTQVEDDANYWSDLLMDYVPTNLVNYNGKTNAGERMQSFKGRSSVSLDLLTERARNLAVNPQVYFQTAIGYILSLYTGSSDVVFGNVTSGRTVPVTGIEDIVGPCIASLPCRLDFASFPTAHEALQQVQSLNRDGLRHCALPLREIARAANVQPGTRLFDTLFVWQQTSSSATSHPLAAKIVDSADDLEFKLTLEFEPCQGFILFRATFDSSIIPESQVKYLFQQVDEIVLKLLDDSSCKMAEALRSFSIPSLSIANPDYNCTPGGVGLSHAVENWAIASPETEAIIFGHISDGNMKIKDKITYLGLNSRANQLAHHLSRHGVRQNHLVCIMMEKSVDLYVAILAVLKLGSGYLPLVPETPVQRVKMILQDAEVAVCISDSGSLKLLQRSHDSHIINLSSTDLSVYSESNPKTPYNGSHIAYAVFTSGSTGTPKGVLVTQQNLMSNLRYLSGLYPASSQSRILQSCSQAFDVSVFEIFFAWHVGMSLCTATKEDLFRDFEASINALGITHLSLTPTVAALVNPDNVPRVEFLVTAGEALTERVRRQWAGRGLYQGTPLLLLKNVANSRIGYGPSETTNICTVRPSVTMGDLISNIGPPFDNTSAFVLDPDSDAILPRGAVGELCFGGEQVFRGYLNRPELNATKLINIAPYGRVYRSGDMGRLLPDDCILSAGRLDDQVKIRGQRVELGEITSIVLNDKDVADSATLLLASENAVKTLVTFWVQRGCESAHFTTADARHSQTAILRIADSLSRRLPVYMLPTYLIPISKIPMTAQAKIDKRVLQATFSNLRDAELTQYAPEQMNMERANNGSSSAAASLSAWEEDVTKALAHTLELEVEQIRPTTSFFNLGLDSVSAIRFCHRLRQLKIADFTVAEVLKNSTITRLGTVHMSQAASPKSNANSPNKPQDVFTEEKRSKIVTKMISHGFEVEKIAPCTPLQEAMLSSSASSGAAYNNTMVFDIKGDIDRLQACWRLAQSRHEILRTSFVQSDHSSFAYAQVALKGAEFQWGQIDTLQDVESRMNTILRDLLDSYKPPWHLAICSEESSAKLIFSCHHALYDGIAITNLLQEIEQAYHDHRLPPVIPYDRYLRHIVSQDVVEADTFWSNRFANFEPTYFPDLTGKTHLDPGEARSTKQDLRVPLSIVRGVSQRASVSVLSLIQAAWVKLLHYYTGEPDVCFGNVVSGRSLPEEGLDRLVAPCFNTIPIRATFDLSRPNSALVQDLHNFNVDSFAYQLTALRRIQNKVLEDKGHLFDTLVILQQSSEPLDETIWSLEEDVGAMDLPVVCEVQQNERNDSLVLTLHYSTDVLSDNDARIVAQMFDYSLHHVIHNFDHAANDENQFPQKLRAVSNANFERLPSDSDLLHKAFEQNAVSLRPDAIALEFLHANGTRTSWSYQTLDKIANRIARQLRHHRVGVDDIVPIHITKSPMFYASMLGVLKAGAAFAPVHPELPDARKDLMIKDLGPKVILCTKDHPTSEAQTSVVLLDVSDLEYLRAAESETCEAPLIENLTTANLAYCLYTSGSTGVPKAVSVEHQSPIQTIESSRSLVPWTTSSRLLQYAAVTFDMCYYDCFMAWTFGFTLCAAEQHILFDNLPHVINSLDATLLDLTPSVAASLSRVEVPRVQWMYCIGEAMSTDVAKEWAGACVNSYGPTEAAFCTTMFPVSHNVKASVIGRPYPSTSFAVFSHQGQIPLPLLSVGELYIGGAQLARGYLGRPELTEERFVIRCGQRFYKSGDIVRMLSDGNFEFIGRADDQIKIRGLRVELGEINQVLHNCDARIHSVATQILKKNTGAKEQLVSFLALGKRVEINEQSDLQRKAKQAAKVRLPAYMVPQIYVLVDHIPMSMAGKVDKKALAGIFEATSGADTLMNGLHTDYKWTNIGLRIRDVLSRLSHTPLDDVLPEMSIYQLGLDSISAVQIASALRNQGFDASASDVMRFNTCADLADHLANQPTPNGLREERFDFGAFDEKHRARVLESCGLDSGLVEAIRPCTPLQQSMVSQFIAKDGGLYYNYLRLELGRSDTDIEKLKSAWETTMMRHPILRTGFAQIEDKQHAFVMIQHKAGSIQLPWSARSDMQPQLATKRMVKLQQEALKNLHHPMWDLQFVTDNEHMFLDLSIFHALFDAHSLQLIFEDVVAIYKNESLKETASVDFALNKLLRLTKACGEQAEKFWSDLGKQVVPSRFPNMAPLRYDPAPPMIATKVSSMSARRIEEGCRESNITLQAAGIASWSTVLSAYTGESTVTLGVVLSGRTSDEAHNAVFPCINTVPFVCTVKESKTEMLQAVMSLSARLHQYQFTPLKDSQRLMGLPNESLFDSLFAFQKSSGGDQQHDLWTVVDEKATTEYPISLELELKREVLEYRLTYLPHIIPPEQAKIVLEQLDHLMNYHVAPNVAHPTGPSLDTSLYSVTQAKDSTLPSETKLLHEFVEFTADRYPGRAALEFVTSVHEGILTKKTWSYQELNAEGNRIAQLLSSYNVQQGELVGVCFDKCPEASFAMLGILKAGCAFVAIDPGAPSARQTFIIEDSGVQAVLTMSTQSAKFKQGVKVPVLDLDEIEMGRFSTTRLLLEKSIDPQNRSYCLYTSGTTGTPKGCELTHENAVQALLAFQRLFAGHWDVESRWLQFASFHFDVSVLEQYWSWSVGICVVSAPRDLIFEDLANSISLLNITHIDLTPSLAQILHPDDVPSLCKGVFITGGESLKQEILDVWGPKGVIYNGYGPTEATIGCTMYPRVPANGKPSNIGPQFDNVGTYVLKPDSDVPMLRGGIGELCVSGKLVGKGYLNRPDLTRQRFSHLDRFNDRVYRTGDLVRILHDGTFDFLGRADDQVKLRGQRLEIGEINSVIRQASKDITDVATLVLKHPKQQKEQLVAFVVIGIKSPREPKVLLVESPNLARAKELCHDRLPPYMVPTHFVPLASMPLNINNKADGKQLKSIYEGLSTTDLQQLSATSTNAENVWSKEEKRLRHVLARALNVEDEAMNKSSSFYELGMDSISVIGVSRAVKQEGYSQASPALLMRYATISRLAKFLSTLGSSTPNHGSILSAQQAISATQHKYRRFVAHSLERETQDIELLAPCTPLQQGMIARYLDSEGGLYFNTFKFNLKDEVDISRLRWAWNTIFERSQLLRTAFVHTDDGHVQAVLRNAPLPWAENDVKDSSRENFVRKLRESWLAANRIEIIRPFELHIVGPSNNQLMLVHMFHGLYDGNSIALLFENLLRVYNGVDDDAFKVPTFHESLPYGPLRKTEGAKQFWEKHLAESIPISLPVLAEEPTKDTIVVTRDLGSIPRYDELRRELNVTAQAIAQVCWLHALQEYADASVTTGIVVSGRSLELENADGIIGPMFNTIPYQQRTQARDTWASAISRVHDFNTEVLPFQHTPLRNILKWCKRSPDQPLFETLFVYQITQIGEDQWRKNSAWNLLDDDAVADYPLAIEIEQKSSDRILLTLVTQGHVSSAKTSNELLDRFEHALKSALADPSTTVPTTIISGALKPRVETSEADISTALKDATSFEWHEHSIAIRDEIATLTGVMSTDINESTSIFELGLDSIDAIKLSSRLKKRNLNLSVSAIMRGLTIKNMVEGIQTNGANDKHPKIEKGFARHKNELRQYAESSGLEMGKIEYVLPLTPLQEAMVADMVNSDYTRYFNFDVAKLAAKTDIAKLIDAWHTVIQSVPILRTAFLEVEDPKISDAYVQAIIKQEDLSSRVTRQYIDTSNEPDFPPVFEDLRRAATQSQVLDPPFKVILVETPEAKYQILAIAHALYDGWSLGLLHDSVHAAYDGSFMPPLPYEATLSDILSESGSEAAAFWRAYLAGMHPSILPRRQLDATDPGRVHRGQVSSDIELRDITEFAKDNRISMQTLGQTVFSIALATYVGTLDVTFGCVLSGRDDVERSQLIFPTMNTVAVRTVLHGSRQELLHYVQDNFNSIKQWQHYPLRKASALAGAQGKMFDSLFIYQKGAEQGASQAIALYRSIESHSDVEYPLCVEMEIVNDSLVWRCAVKEEVMDPSDAEVLLNRLNQVLRSIMQSPEAATIDSTPDGTSLCGLPMAKPHALEQNGDEEHPGTSSSSPSSLTASQIRAALASVAQLPLEDIQPTMSIFHIGLDSISAIKVSSLLRKQGITLTVGQMLRAGTVEKMALVAEQLPSPPQNEPDLSAAIDYALRGLDRNKVLDRANIHTSNVAQILPLTAGQVYMVSMWLNTRGRLFYPEFNYTLRGEISFEALENAWQTLISANPILRTHIVATQQAALPYVQIVLKKAHASITDTATLSADAISLEMERRASMQPWVHLSATRETGGWKLRLRIHHALYDGVSLPLLMQQLQDYCNDIATSPTLSTAEDALERYVALTHTGSTPDAREGFWKNYLEGVTPRAVSPPTTLPAGPTLRTEIFHPQLLPSSSLEALARTHGVSSQALFLAVFAASYKTYSARSTQPGASTNSSDKGKEEVVMGIYLANRSLTLPDSSPSFDLPTAPIPTLNILPLRIRSPRTTPLLAVAAQIQQDLRALSEPQVAGTGLWEIDAWTGVKIDVCVNFLSLPSTVEDEGVEGMEGVNRDVRIKAVEGWQHTVSRTVPLEEEQDWTPPQAVTGQKQVNEAYVVSSPPPTQLLTLEQGETLVEDLRVRIEELGSA